MKEEFWIKLMQAKAMELEAFQSLVPENIKEHAEMIGKEIKEMAEEMCPLSKFRQTSDVGESKGKKGATKITVE